MGTKAVVAKFLANFHGSYTDTQTGAGESGEIVSAKFGEQNSVTFTGGTGANQANRVWPSENRILSTSASELIDVYDFGTLDIGSGAGKDQHGGSLALTGIKGFYVKNRSTSAGNLLVGGEGTTAAWNSLFNGSDTALISLPPGAIVMITNPSSAGYAVADTTNHLLKIAADSGGAVAYDIAIVGI